MALQILMVAEKPSISESIAQILSKNKFKTHKGTVPVHEFEGTFQGQYAHYKSTSVIGHIYSTDFAPEYQNWEKTNPVDLFDAPVRKVEANPKAHICRHLQNQAKGADVLILWLDCDREGENICFEVIENTRKWMKRDAEVYRARFSGMSCPRCQWSVLSRAHLRTFLFFVMTTSDHCARHYESDGNAWKSQLE
jgi:DNA topoisomerase-3